MKTFIIHMAGDTRRAPNVAKLRAGLPGAEVVDAVRGAEVLARGGHPVAAGNLHAPGYPFALSGGELGCFLSHRACWQRIVERGLDWALVVEDDLAVEPEAWARAFELACAHAGPGRFIRLPAKDRERPARVLDASGEARLFLPRVIGLQTVAQVVGREAARRLLAASAVIDRPVDTFLQMHWVTGQPVHTILPSGVRELTDELGGSTIQARPAGGRVRRELLRALYRARVARRPQLSPDR